MAFPYVYNQEGYFESGNGNFVFKLFSQGEIQ